MAPEAWRGLPAPSGAAVDRPLWQRLICALRVFGVLGWFSMCPVFAQVDPPSPQPVYLSSPSVEQQLVYFWIGFGMVVPLMTVPIITHYARRAARAGRPSTGGTD